MPFHRSLNVPFAPPTLVQLVALVHATPSKTVCVEPAGFGVVAIDQLVPFHFSTNDRSTPLTVESPTAKQTVALVHATPLRSVTVEPVGFGLLEIAHVVPFQRSTSEPVTPLTVASPTARQFVVLVHATPLRTVLPEPVGLGLLTIDQAVPFHRSTSDEPLLLFVPTASQFVVLGHATPLRIAPKEPLGFGLLTIDHAVPFHRSTNVCATNELFRFQPTAAQFVVLEHATAPRLAAAEPLGFGLLTIAQLVPFQCSTNVLPPVPLSHSPTAKQLVVLGHATPANRLSIAPLGLGMATTDHAVPFQCSTNARAKNASAAADPTAKQLVALGHATLRKRPSGGPCGLGLVDKLHPGTANAGPAMAPMRPTTTATTTSTRDPRPPLARRRTRRLTARCMSAPQGPPFLPCVTLGTGPAPVKTCCSS